METISSRTINNLLISNKKFAPDFLKLVNSNIFRNFTTKNCFFFSQNLEKKSKNICFFPSSGNIRNETKQNFIAEQRRYLSLHEYQSKQLLREFGLNVQHGKEANTSQEALEIAEKLRKDGANDLILKCQIKAGGRGKGKLSSGLQGGVKICSTPDEVYMYSQQMLNYKLVTHQTSPQGELVKQVLIHEGVTINKELYLAILLDRSVNGPAIISSSMGGMDIEEVANNHPEAIKVVPINMFEGLTKETAEIVVREGLQISEELVCAATEQVMKLWSLFIQCDATQVEINPLAITTTTGENNTQKVVCVDAKIQFDDSAAYRQKKLFDLEDKDSIDPRELAAEKAGINFVAMDGNIGCLVNGAGLAMATMDIVSLYGGSPANFLDVGGGANVYQVTEALKILQSDEQVKALFINIFGGIMRCDTIAEGLVAAAKMVSLELPLVIRLCGNRVEEALKILSASGLKCDVLEDLDEAAKLACSYVKS